MATKSIFETVYESTTGVGGYSPSSATDHAFAYDGSSSGRRDHVFFYRPGAGNCSVIRRKGSDFEAIYAAETGGIGGFDFSFSFDRAFAFDYDHSGKVDHVVCFRPGAGSVFILKHDGNGNFAPVYTEASAETPTEDAGNGIGGWDFAYPWDRMIAFDFDKTGKMDHLLIYRREMAHIVILKNYDGKFGQVYHEWCWGAGGFRGGSSSWYAFAFDWEHVGRLDHILCIDMLDFTKPTTVLAHQGDKFVAVWSAVGPIGGFPKPAGTANYGGVDGLEVWKHICFPFDFGSTGRDDYVGILNAAEGKIWIMVSRQSDGNWNYEYRANGEGIGNWDVRGGMKDRCFAFDLNSSGCNDHIFTYRRNSGKIWITRVKKSSSPPLVPITPQPPATWPPPVIPRAPRPGFTPVVQTTAGIPGFDLGSPDDRCFVFDYDHSGKTDHLCFYRPGTGLAWIGKWDQHDGLTQVWTGYGVGGFDLKMKQDRAFAFDYDHMGRLDHICFYRPGTGVLYIIGRDDGEFMAEFGNAQLSAVPGWGALAAADRAFAFDYDSSGRRDYLVIYRPGAGTIAILQHARGTFEPVYKQQNLAGYDLMAPQDRVFAYDYSHNGKLDHLVCLRFGGAGNWAAVVRNIGGKFSIVYQHRSVVSGDGIFNEFVGNGGWVVPFGGWDLESTLDHAFPYDFNSTGKQDHICIYRPGSGFIFVIQNLMGGFSPAYQGYGSGTGSFGKKALPYGHRIYWPDGTGLGGYDLMAKEDHCLPFDLRSTGCCDHIVVFRPGQKLLTVVQPVNTPASIKVQRQQ